MTKPRKPAAPEQLSFLDPPRAKKRKKKWDGKSWETLEIGDEREAVAHD